MFGDDNKALVIKTAGKAVGIGHIYESIIHVHTYIEVCIYVPAFTVAPWAFNVNG